LYKNTRLNFAQNLGTISTLSEKRSLKFLIKVVNSTALQLPAAQAQQKLHTAYLTSWKNSSIFGYKLGTV